jgi:hypothetical protein
MPDYVAASVAARLTGVPVRTIRHWVSGGKMAAIADPRGKLVGLAAVRASAASHGNTASEAALPPAADGNHAAESGHDGQMPDPAGALPGIVELVGRLHAENPELAGRCGFYQAENRELRARVAALAGEVKLLTARTPEPAEAELAVPPKRPRWAFWRRGG